MNGKQQAILTLKAIIDTEEGERVDKDYLQDKLDAMLTMERPRVLLSEEGQRKFNEFAQEEAKKGNIIYSSNN